MAPENSITRMTNMTIKPQQTTQLDGWTTTPSIDMTTMLEDLDQPQPNVEGDIT